MRRGRAGSLLPAKSRSAAAARRRRAPASGLLSPSTVTELRQQLLEWYDRKRRALPWRREVSLYGTWVAEIMLQQTTVAAATPYWERFMSRFPSLRALADADEQAVLALWSGLGYYDRARRLHAAARELAGLAAGRLPRTAAQWRTVPGVGAYTAGAIASIALGEAVPAVDANARRVLLRLCCAEPADAVRLGGSALERGPAALLVDPERPGDWNQALMELGALVCLPEAPRCQICPIAGLCRARAAGTTAEIPAVKMRPVPRPVVLSLLVLCQGEAVLMAAPGSAPSARVSGCGRPTREDFSGLHRGLWGLPSTPWYSLPITERGARARDGFTRAAVAAWHRWLAKEGLRLLRSRSAVLTDAGSFRHAITDHRLTVRVVRGALQSGSAVPRLTAWWKPPSLPPALSALARKALVRAGIDVDQTG